MTAISLAANLIAMAEGCRLIAYWDKTGKVWTIGFGHTSGVKQGDVITFDEAVEFLAEDETALVDLIAGKSILEGAALLDFGFNCGKGALQHVLDGTIQITDTGFVKDGVAYGETSGGIPLAGLKARRQLEAALIAVARAA